MEKQKKLKTGAKGCYEEKKSRFMAETFVVESEKEAEESLNAVRKRYWDAKHHCYAYRIGADGQLCRSSDDGEPSGTAGKPILETINGCGVTNCLCVVTRYFGGTLLGTGGLVRAYQKAAKDALARSLFVMLMPAGRYRVTTDYAGIGKIQYLIPRFRARVIGTEYAEYAAFTFEVVKEDSDALLSQITEATAGKAEIRKEADVDMELPYFPESFLLD